MSANSEEIEKAQQIVNYALARLDPGDSFALARIDTASFSEKDIIARVTFDDRPSTANSQKRQFQVELNEFVADVRFTPPTVLGVPVRTEYAWPLLIRMP